jgi:hypothetical protein
LGRSAWVTAFAGREMVELGAKLDGVAPTPPRAEVESGAKLDGVALVPPILDGVIPPIGDTLAISAALAGAPVGLSA